MHLSGLCVHVYCDKWFQMTYGFNQNHPATSNGVGIKYTENDRLATSCSNWYQIQSVYHPPFFYNSTTMSELKLNLEPAVQSDSPSMSSGVLQTKVGPSNIQYIPRNMHTVFALLCFVVVIHWLIFSYPSRLLHWHCGNLTIAPVLAKQPWWIWINTSCEFIMNDCITTTKQSTTKPCAYFLGYTVSTRQSGPV